MIFKHQATRFLFLIRNLGERDKLRLRKINNNFLHGVYAASFHIAEKISDIAAAKAFHFSPSPFFPNLAN